LTKILDIADLSDDIEVDGVCLGKLSQENYPEEVSWVYKISWQQLFMLICDQLEDAELEGKIFKRISKTLFIWSEIGRLLITDSEPKLYISSFMTIKLQFQALGLVSIEYISGDKYWKLTDAGRNTMVSLFVVRTQKNIPEEELPF
jgi:predicted transcriptional regulator with HTH domain